MIDKVTEESLQLSASRVGNILSLRCLLNMSYLIYYELIFIAECSEFRKGGWRYFSHILRDGDYERASVDMDGHSSPTFRELGRSPVALG